MLSVSGPRMLYFFCWTDGRWLTISAGDLPTDLAQMNLWTPRRNPTEDSDSEFAEILLREQMDAVK
jgi:hypothetical protein